MATKGKGQISATISIVDNATKQLDQINRRLAATQKPFRDLGKSLGQFADVSGLKAIGERLGKITQAGRSAALSLADMITPLSAITGAASIAGIYALTTRFAQFGFQLQQHATMVRMTATDYQALQNAGREAGVSSESMASGIDSLNDVLHDSVGGRNPEAVLMFNKLGIAFRDSAGHARKVQDVLPELADKIAGIKDPFYQAAVAQRFFGGAARDMLPFLRNGAKGLEEYRQAAIKHGLVNQEGVDNAIKLQRANTDLTMSVEGLGYAVASKMSPAFTGLIEELANLIDANRDKVATFFGGVADNIKKWVDEGGIQAVTQRLVEFYKNVDHVVQSIGGWGEATKMIFGLWATAKVAGLIGDVAKVTLAFSNLTVGVQATEAAVQALNTTAMRSPALRMLALTIQAYEPAGPADRPGHPAAGLAATSPWL